MIARNAAGCLLDTIGEVSPFLATWADSNIVHSLMQESRGIISAYNSGMMHDEAIGRPKPSKEGWAHRVSQDAIDLTVGDIDRC